MEIINTDIILINLAKAFKKHDTVVIAVSGGPDSMALLHLVTAVKLEKDLTVVCAHVNHNIRKESAKELEFVKKYCQLNDIIFESLTIEKYSGENFHKVARNIRYDFFEKVIKTYKASYLLTAHHADDLIETILMRITRGSTLKGYAGFEESIERTGYTILRPLINTSKEEILNYCKKYSVKYVSDKSNKSSKYTRNRFRKNILPAIKKETHNPNYKFYNFSQTLIEADSYIEKVVTEKCKNIICNNEVNLELLNKEDFFIQKRVINRFVSLIYKENIDLISLVHIELLFKMINNNKMSDNFTLPNGFIAEKNNGLLKISLEFKSEGYYFELSENLKLPNGKAIAFIDQTDDNSNNVTRLNSRDLNFPLFAVTRKNGEKMSVKGMKGTKKINDIFIDMKIEKRERDLWPIVVDQNGSVVWVPGLKKSTFDKTKDESHDIILKYH